VDSFECVLSIYFSGVRHNLRAAFILCDELVEVTLLAKIREQVRNPGYLKFYDLLTHPVTSLNPKSQPLGNRLHASHNTRNNMQHNNAAAAVDVQHCADAICDAVECIEHCFPGSKTDLPDGLKTALRVVCIYSTNGDTTLRDKFEEAMLKHPWRDSSERADSTQLIVAPGRRRHWGLVIMSNVAAIDTILMRINAP
jgi:hypothetical protein